MRILVFSLCVMVAAPVLASIPKGTASFPAPAYQKLPLVFEANRGQTDARVRFMSRGSGYTLYLTPREVILNLQKGSGSAEKIAVRMALAGASSVPAVEGLDPQKGSSSYFIGSDPARWRTGIPHYGRVRYKGVYPGIDLVFYGRQRQLEYDFVVAPGADASRIRLSFDGARGLRLDSNGDLVLDTGAGEIRQLKPNIYQDAGGVRQTIEGRYRILGKRSVAVQVAKYDRARPLVIDPVLSYSTLLGGSGTEGATGIAVDSTGSAYVTGYTISTDFPTTTGSYRSSFAGGNPEVFVAKLTPDGTGLAYSTYLGGNSDDRSVAIAVDSGGNAYITGYTGSTDFPTTSGAFQTSGYGIFVTKLNSTGTGLIYSTYVGGGTYGYGSVYGMAIDDFGNVYLAGTTYAPNFPVTAGVVQGTMKMGPDAFVTKLNSSGSGLVYSTFLGGSSNDTARAIAVDRDGNAYVTGSTSSSDFPKTLGAFQAILKGTQNAFVAKLNASGTALVYSSFLGGQYSDTGVGIAVDGVGNAFVSGWASSSDFPTTVGAFQPSMPPWYGPDSFLVKFTADGASLGFGTFLASSIDQIQSAFPIVLDSSGNGYFIGTGNILTSSGAIQPSPPGPPDTFIGKLDSTGGILLYSTYLGGSGPEYTGGMAMDPAGNLYVTGTTYSTNFPATPGALQTTLAGGNDAFVVKIDMAGGSCTYSLTETSRTFDYTGGTGTIGITAPSGCVWVASATQGMVTITAGATGTGNGAISYSVARNDSTSTRSGSIAVGGQTFNISQGGAPCTYSLQPASRSFDSSGGISSFTVVTPIGCSWTAVNGASWITMSGLTSSSASGTVFFTVAPNTGPYRSASISVAGQSFTVEQAASGMVCSYTLSSTSQSFGSSGGAGNVNVTAPGGCPWTSASNAGWISITSGATDSGDGSVVFLVSANNTAAARTGTMTIAGQTVTISQAAGSATAAPGDFDGNGMADLVWLNDATRQATVNYYGGAQGNELQGWNWLNAGGTPGWQVVAAADFDGNGIPDLVWQNDTTRQVTVHYYGGTGGATLVGWNWLLPGNMPGWHVTGAADFNGDGVPDLIWQNDTTRQVTVHYYGGTGGGTLVGWNWLQPGNMAGWHVAGAADFNGDGVPDLIWQNDTTCQVTVHYYGGTGGAVLQGWNWLQSGIMTGWQVAGAADFDGNGTADLVWLNDTTRQVTVHYYGGAQGNVLQGWNWLNSSGVPGWTVIIPR